MHTRVSEIGQKHPGSLKDRSLPFQSAPVSSARGHSRDSGHFFWVLLNAATPQLPPFSRGLDAVPSAVRCEKKQQELHEKTRTSVEEAESDNNSPSASKQRGVSQFPSPLLIQSGQLRPFSTTNDFTLTPIYACK